MAVSQTILSEAAGDEPRVGNVTVAALRATDWAQNAVGMSDDVAREILDMIVTMDVGDDPYEAVAQICNLVGNGVPDELTPRGYQESKAIYANVGWNDTTLFYEHGTGMWFIASPAEAAKQYEDEYVDEMWDEWRDKAAAMETKRLKKGVSFGAFTEPRTYYPYHYIPPELEPPSELVDLLTTLGYEIVGYVKGIAVNVKTRKEAKIGKLLLRIKDEEIRNEYDVP